MLLSGCWAGGGGAGAVVKVACLESHEIVGSNPALAFNFQINKNVSSPLTRKSSLLWGAFVTERPSLAYMCTKNPFISFHFISGCIRRIDLL